MEEKICEVCGRTFRRRTSYRLGYETRSQFARRRTCSRRCHYQLREAWRNREEKR